MGDILATSRPSSAANGPVYHVSAISHRNNAILPVVVAGEPTEENHTVWGTGISAQVLRDLRAAGIPVTAAWIPLRSALHWLVVTVPRDWRHRTAIDTAQAFCQHIGETMFKTKAGVVVPK